MFDNKPRKNLSTYTHCSSFADIFLSLPSLNKNLVDRCAYRATRSKEEEILSFVKTLAGLGREGFGITTSGSSEAILTALSLHLLRFRSRRPGVRANFVISPLYHNVFEKFAVLFDVEMRTPSLRSSCSMSALDAETYVDENTFCLVGIAGSTEAASIDDLVGLTRLSQQHDIPLHIDAAVGGMVLPFVSDVSWHFGHTGCASMNISLAKFGRAVPGIGVLLLRDESYVSEKYRYEMEYLSGGKSGDPGLLCSRSSYPVVHFHRLVRRDGYPGFRRYIDGCLVRTAFLSRMLSDAGFEVLPTPLPVLIFRHPQEEVTQRLLKDLRQQGFTISHAPIRTLGTRYSRIVVRGNVSSRVIAQVRDSLWRIPLRRDLDAKGSASATSLEALR